MTVWQFIPLFDYMEKSASAPEPQRGIFRHIWDHYFTRTKSVEETEVEFVGLTLQSAPARLLDWISPPPNWQESCGPKPQPSNNNHSQSKEVSPESTEPLLPEPDSDAGKPESTSAAEAVCTQLSLALSDWERSQPQSSGVYMLLAAPHSGVDEMVRGWAKRQGHHLPDPPARRQIQDSSAQWFNNLEEKLDKVTKNQQHDTRIVLVGLEQYYLRHHNGLNFLREVLDYLTTEAPSSLVVCNSWAWAYFRDALHIDAMMRSPLTLERIAGDSLGTWLIELSGGSHHRTFTFRQDEDVLFTVERGVLSDLNEDSYHRFCARLAEVSRGNPGIARAIWRHSMSIEATVDVQEQVQREAEDDPGHVIWIQRIHESILPIVPATFTNNDAFILQTLLIHNSLPRDLLPDLLPLSASLISRRIQVMLNANLVRLREGLLEVSPMGYFPVRAFLRESGFFVDDL